MMKQTLTDRRGIAADGVLRTLALAAALASFGCVSAPSSPPCAFSDSDRAWIDRSVEAWRFASRDITDIANVPDLQGIFFSADCILESENALSIPGPRRVAWTATPHDGTVPLPDGSEMPAGVTSFVSGQDGVTYFVMSTPSVWEASGVGKNPELATMMVAVLLHEGSHVAQIGPYGSRLDALLERNNLPDSFNDNAVQERFRANVEFSESIQQETRLFLEAAEAEDDAEARRLAREARRMMRERQARWMIGDDAYLIEAEDIWLTFEGAGQWTGYQWLVHPDGGAQSTEESLARFTRGRQWSQTEGFAVVMALDRIIGPRWKQHAFGDGARTVLEMLDDALG